MAVSLPPGYKRIRDVLGAPGESHSFMGVAIQVDGPITLNNGDMVLNFALQDEFPEGMETKRDSIYCKQYRKIAVTLPTGAIGDMVLVRNMEVISNVNRPPTGLSSSGMKDDAEVIFIPAAVIPGPFYSSAFGLGGTDVLSHRPRGHVDKPSPREQAAVIQMFALAPKSLSASAPVFAKTTPIAPRHMPKAIFKSMGKNALIQDIAPGNFYDLTAEVVKIWHGPYAQGTVDLYLTDYTVNKSLHCYTDDVGHSGSHGWQGPLGQATMLVRLWEPHTSWAKEHVQVGDMLYLRNVHAKNSALNTLEGALHGDQRYPEKVLVYKAFHGMARDSLLGRKKAYLKDNKPGNLNGTEGADAGAMETSEPKSPTKSKTYKKKQRKLQKKQQEQMELEKTAEDKTIAQAGVNPHVRAAHPTIERSTVDEIMHNDARIVKNLQGDELELPFVCTKYRCRLRVVDFLPSDIRYFARSMADPEWNTALKDPAQKGKRRDDSWQWGFTLLLEDADVPAGTEPVRFPVYVNDEGGQYLLKLDATDLTRDINGDTLKKLEEKLFILWGNLAELKRELKGAKFPLPSGDKRLQNMPFECCINEYGTKIPKTPKEPHGYRRMHNLFDTTIMG